MNVMDMNSLYKHSVGLLLPKSNQIIKGLGKRKRLPNISPRERTLIIKAPTAFKQSYKTYIEHSNDKSLQSDEFRSLKELFEKSLNKDHQDYIPPLPPICKTPLKSIGKQEAAKYTEKIMITTHRRFLASRPLKVKKKELNYESKMSGLSVVSRSLSKKSLEVEGIGHGDEKVRFDERKAWKKNERTDLKKEGAKTDRKEGEKKVEEKKGNIEVRQGDKRILTRGRENRRVIDKETMNKSIELRRNEDSDEDRMNIYENFDYI